MGKESIPAQLFKSIFIPKEEYGLENLPEAPTIHKKYSEMSADVPNYSPMLKRRDTANGCVISLVPTGTPSLGKL